MFHLNFFFSRYHGKPLINPAEIRKGTVLTHLPTNTRHTAVYAVAGDVLLIDGQGHLSAPTEKQLAYCYRTWSSRIRSNFELDMLWQKACALYEADKRLLTRLGLRTNPEQVRRILAV